MSATITDTATIKPFLDDNFLLENYTAEVLYHEYAKNQPIIDYHCHLPPDEIAQDKKFANLTRIWLNGDHYKWRAMRTLGIPEDFITGNADDFAKFQKWAETVPYTARNPLYHWTHLELRRYFDIDKLLKPESAKEIYDEASSLLNTANYSVQNLLHKMNVEVVCTTDDPTDSLQYHQQIQSQGFGVKILPAFRPDKAILIENQEFNNYIQKLSNVVNSEIRSFADLLEALQQRADFFSQLGCKLCDHGLEQVYAVDFTDAAADAIFKKKLTGQAISTEEATLYKSAVLYHLGKIYHASGWTQQFHLGALRSNNSRMLRQLGPDTGFDSIGDFEQASALAKFLDRLDTENALAKTILYNVNPCDNEILATMIGNFNDGSIKGKMQFGSAWWFLDQKDGMTRQLNALSNMGLLSCFIGMLTDSRSFMSFPRHEYFRRLLCNLLGKDVHNGELPNDIEWLGGLVQDICYRNAKQYFDF